MLGRREKQGLFSTRFHLDLSGADYYTSIIGYPQRSGSKSVALRFGTPSQEKRFSTDCSKVGKENSGNIVLCYKDWGTGRPIVFSHVYHLFGRRRSIKKYNVETTMHPQRSSNLIDSIIPNQISPQRMQPDRARHFFRQGLLAILLGVACAVPVMAAPIRLPAIVEPASQEHHLGKLIFIQLVTPDLAAAKQFYGGLFGWTFRDIQAGGTKYSEAFLDGRPVAEMIHKNVPANEHRQPAWLSFFAVGDVDAAKKVALKNGAKVLFEPHSIPDRGREAVFADPQGAVFAVLASSSGDPPDVLAAPGEWIWISLITRDPDTATAFYQGLFDYEVFELPASEGVQHLLLASDNYARASVNTLPANRPNAHPHWLNYVRVEDTVKMTAKVVALGGRVLVEPRIDRHGGKVAVVADPLGAPFGLLEWPDTESKEVPK
jgi:predicted enzyme related to lactoylglutathione lyase